MSTPAHDYDYTSNRPCDGKHRYLKKLIAKIASLAQRPRNERLKNLRELGKEQIKFENTSLRDIERALRSEGMLPDDYDRKIPPLQDLYRSL